MFQPRAPAPPKNGEVDELRGRRERYLNGGGSGSNASTPTRSGTTGGLSSLGSTAEGVSPRSGPGTTKEKRQYLIDVGAVTVIDQLVTELVWKRPPKAAVLSTLQDILQQMQGFETMPEAKQATLLCEAAAAGDYERLTSMLESGATASLGDYDRRTPLHLAAEEGYVDCAALLLEKGADINAADRWGAQPLDGARLNGKTAMAQYLQERGAKPGRGVATGGDALVDCVRLCAAAGRGDITALTDLLNSGLSPAVEDYDFRTPLHLAAEEGKNDCVRLLVERGAPIDAKDRWGTTPIQGAIDRQKKETETLLRRLGAKVESGRRESFRREEDEGKGGGDTNASMMFHAAQKGQLVIVKGLLDKGMDPNTADYDLRTPLHLAAEEGFLDVVELLVQRGADVNVKDRWGTTPLSGSLHNCHNDIGSFLKDAGAEAERLLTALPALDYHQRAATFFETTARLCNLHKDTVLPSYALLRRLTVEYGFNLNHHRVLLAELKQLSRKRSDPAVLHLSTRWPSFDSFIGTLSLTDYPTHEFAPDEVILLSDWLSALTVKEHSDEVTPAILLQTVVFDKLSVPSWQHFVRSVCALFEEVRKAENSGQTAQYIPELKNADPEPFALSVCSVEGQECHFGEFAKTFSVQSTGKTFAYTMALAKHGKEYVHNYVGQEPSGRAFNDFTLTRQNHPFNPVTNAGSIVTCSMVEEQEEDVDKRLETYKAFLTGMGGDTAPVGDCMDVFRSEQSCAFRNFALANFMRAENTFPEHVQTHQQLETAVNFYLRVCATEVSTPLLARIAGTYANVGVSPLSGKRMVNESEVKQTLQILYSCGMYDYSGEWACTIGMPAKSGVSGNIFIVVPGILGMCIWSPRLDDIGNSVRGIRLAKAFSEKFRFSILDTLLRTKEAGSS